MTQVRREISFTKGRIIVRGKLVIRGKSLCYARYLVRIRISVSHLDARYLLLALNTAHVREQSEVTNTNNCWVEKRKCSRAEKTHHYSSASLQTMPHRLQSNDAGYIRPAGSAGHHPPKQKVAACSKPSSTTFG